MIEEVDWKPIMAMRKKVKQELSTNWRGGRERADQELWAQDWRKKSVI